MRQAAGYWVVSQLEEKGLRGHASVREDDTSPTRRAEFKLPDDIHAITEDEIRALHGDRQAISPSSLKTLIQDGKAYEETFELWGSHVVVLYVRQDDGTIRTLLIRNDGEVVYRLHYFLPPRQAALVYFFEIDVDLKDAEKAKAAITAPDIERTPLRIADAINQVETDPSRIIDLIREFIDANIPGEGKELVNAILDFVAVIPPEHVTLILDFLQLMLDIVGMFPGAGESADLANAAISAERGQKLDAVVGVAAMVPVAGALPGIGKALWRIRRIVNLANALPAGLRGILLDLVSGLTDELMSLASRKLSDIVSGLKRRINEATDRLRIFAKKGDDASLPGRSGKQNSPSSSSKGNDTPAGPPPSKTPAIPNPESKPPSKKPSDEETTSKATEPKKPEMPEAGRAIVDIIRGNQELRKLMSDVARKDMSAAEKAEALRLGAAKIPGIKFEPLDGIPGAEAVFIGKQSAIGTPLLVVLKDGRVFEGGAETGLVGYQIRPIGELRIMLTKLREKR